MKRLKIIAALAAALMATGCASQAEVNSLRAENARLKQELSEYSAVTTSNSDNSSDITGSDNSNELSPFDQYVKDNNITLDNYDVQYDMGNNLNKEFTIVGTAELDDYYNYGFDDDIESDYFCIMVTPEDGKFTNRWYIYAERTTFKDFFDDLKGGKCRVKIVAEIPSSRYKSGQNCMAMLNFIAW